MDVNFELDRFLKRAAGDVVVPPEDPARLHALLAAFDRAQRAPLPKSRRDYWWMGMLATAAALMIAIALTPAVSVRHGASSAAVTSRAAPSDVDALESVSAGGFVPIPGTMSLPPLESGSLVRMELPVSILPSLGMTPPATGHATEVTADIIVGQDGVPRAVRLVE